MGSLMKNRAFVIVHAGYKKGNNRHNALVKEIAGTIARKIAYFLENKGEVYYLRDNDSPIIPEEIEKYLGQMTAVEDSPGHLLQYLNAKDRMRDDKIGLAYLCGAYLKECVRDLDELLRAEKKPKIAYDRYEDAVKGLEGKGWSVDVISTIYSHKIATAVLDDPDEDLSR